MGSFRSLHDLCRRTPTDENRRSTGRVLVESVQSEAGEFLDLSATGARFETKLHWSVGQTQTMTIELKSMDEKLELTATCVWVKDVRRKKQQVGVVFESLDSKQRNLLTRIATRSLKGTWATPAPVRDKTDWQQLGNETQPNQANHEAA